jgi:hypothetical protein
VGAVDAEGAVHVNIEPGHRHHFSHGRGHRERRTPRLSSTGSIQPASR